ncbi:hypothetical protein MIR68_000181 [Amoeboaphelidium protococcarum]|nr:hypothetical protein MIR68_000181 [Amoeboaphelidium protococcarum]
MMMMNEEEEVWNLENQDVADWKDEWEQELILSTEKDVQKVTEWKDAQQMLLSKFFDTMEKIEPVLKTQSLMLKVLGISDMIRDLENMGGQVSNVNGGYQVQIEEELAEQFMGMNMVHFIAGPKNKACPLMGDDSVVTLSAKHQMQVD